MSIGNNQTNHADAKPKLPSKISGTRYLPQGGEASFDVVMSPHSGRANSIHYAQAAEQPGQAGKPLNSAIKITDNSGVTYNIDLTHDTGARVSAMRGKMPLMLDAEKIKQVLLNGKDIMSVPFQFEMEKNNVDPLITQGVSSRALKQLNQALDHLDKNLSMIARNAFRPTHHRTIMANHMGALASPTAAPILHATAAKTDSAPAPPKDAAKPLSHPSQFQPT